MLSHLICSFWLRRVEHFFTCLLAISFMWITCSCALFIFPIGRLVFLIMIYNLFTQLLFMVQINCVSHLTSFNEPPRNLVKRVWVGWAVLLVSPGLVCFYSLAGFMRFVCLSLSNSSLLWDQSHCTSCYQPPAWVLSFYVLLAKASHMVEPGSVWEETTQGYIKRCDSLRHDVKLPHVSSKFATWFLFVLV